MSNHNYNIWIYANVCLQKNKNTLDGCLVEHLCHPLMFFSEKDTKKGRLWQMWPWH